MTEGVSRTYLVADSAAARARAEILHEEPVAPKGGPVMDVKTLPANTLLRAVLEVH
jgi:hypothetical protein